MRAAGGLKKKLFDKACETAPKRYELAEQGNSVFLSIRHRLLDKLAFSKIRDDLGGRVTGALTASAAMNKEIGLFFSDMGIPVCDCYGLAETAPAVTMNCSSAGGSMVSDHSRWPWYKAISL